MIFSTGARGTDIEVPKDCGTIDRWPENGRQPDEWQGTPGWKGRFEGTWGG